MLCSWSVGQRNLTALPTVSDSLPPSSLKRAFPLSGLVFGGPFLLWSSFWLQFGTQLQITKSTPSLERNVEKSLLLVLIEYVHLTTKTPGLAS